MISHKTAVQMFLLFCFLPVQISRFPPVLQRQMIDIRKVLRVIRDKDISS